MQLDSFGNQTASSGSLRNFFRYAGYAGREFDTETNLYYNRAASAAGGLPTRKG